MKRVLIIIGWISIVISSISLFWYSSGVRWDPLLIFITLSLGVALVFGIITLIKLESVANIPLLLGGFSLCCICTVLEIEYFFLISMLYFIGLIAFFISYSYRKKNESV